MPNQTTSKISTTTEKFDEMFMQQAFELALKSCGHTRPNPPVGAVVVKANNVIGRGRHLFYGGDHAEVAALKDCKETPKNATVYCTLEPCSKPGRVGACCDALIAAGVNRVVWACPDPNPKNAGKAAQVLCSAGIRCTCLAESKCEELRRLARNIRDMTVCQFAKHITTGLPFVRVKLAMSLDGKICDYRGESQWISCKKSRDLTGSWRAYADVIMVGAETVRKDNPSLLCHNDLQHNADLWRAIISRSGDLPKDAQVFTDEEKDHTLVYSDPVEAVKDLGKRGFMYVLCEGGLELARSLAEAGLVDAWDTVLCPIVIGNQQIGKAIRFPNVISSRIEDDTLVEAKMTLPPF